MLGDRLSFWFERVGHVWLENPVRLVRFLGPLTVGSVCLLSDLFSRRLPAAMADLGTQTLKLLVRGIVPVIVLGLALAEAARAAATAIGRFLEPVVTPILLPLVLREALPLILAIVLAARSGAALAAKIATHSGTAIDEVPRDVGYVRRVVLPNLIGTAVTAAAFFTILAGCALSGYLEPSGLPTVTEIPRYLTLAPYGPDVTRGLWKTTVYGVIVAYTAAALGTYDAEDLELARRDLRHYAVWESTVTAIVLCAGLAAVLWRPVTVGGGRP